MHRAVSADYEITIDEPSRRLDFQTVAGPVRPHGCYDLAQVLSGTQLTFSLEVRLGGLQKLLMGSMVQKTMNAEVRNLDNLKRLLEAMGLRPASNLGTPGHPRGRRPAGRGRRRSGCAGDRAHSA